MIRSWVRISPIVLLMLAVFYSRVYGNDKAPFLVFFVLGLNVVLVLAMLAIEYMRPGPGRWLDIGVASLPLLYATAVVVLGHHGSVDTEAFLGFR